MHGIDRRIELLEKQLITRLTHLVVMVKAGEKKESAIKRMMAEYAILTIPDDCSLIVLNLNK